MSALVFVVMGTGLVLIGRWGWRHAPDMVEPGLSERQAARRLRVARRGALASHVVAAMFLIFAVASLFSG